MDRNKLKNHGRNHVIQELPMSLNKNENKCVLLDFISQTNEWYQCFNVVTKTKKSKIDPFC